ncbi:MAG: ARPP-1 family domain-containing protein [Candidatus Hodarchaeota archaeon]
MKKGTKEILIHLVRNPGSTKAMINLYFTKSIKSALTTATIYQRIHDLEKKHLLTRLPTDKNRYILTLAAEKLIMNQNLLLQEDRQRLGLNTHHIINRNNRRKTMKFEEIIHDLTDYYNIGKPITHDKYIVYPLFHTNQLTSIMGLLEAEEKEVAWIQESEGSESVSTLEAINKSETLVLIPFLHQVEGGKQDRTIFEPILIPVGHDVSNPLHIPARCIEQSRWTYSTSRGKVTSSKFKSAKTRMASQMANISSKVTDQSTVWETVSAAGIMYNLSSEEAPTSSYREMQERIYEKDENLGKLLEAFSTALKLKDQVGIICLYGDKLLGLEVFGSSKLWNQFSELVLKGFLSDSGFMKKVETKQGLEHDFNQIIKTEFKEVKVSKEHATGSGEFYRFNSEKWQGCSILHEGHPIHLYASKKHVDILKGRGSRFPIYERGIQNQEFAQIPEQEIMRRAAPEQIQKNE